MGNASVRKPEAIGNPIQELAAIEWNDDSALDPAERALRTLCRKVNESSRLREFLTGLPSFSSWLSRAYGSVHIDSGNEAGRPTVVWLQYFSEHGLIIDRRGVIRVVTRAGYSRELAFNKRSGEICTAELDVALIPVTTGVEL